MIIFRKVPSALRWKYSRSARLFSNDFKDSLTKNLSSFKVRFAPPDLDTSTNLLKSSKLPQSTSEYEDKARSVSHEVLDSLIREGLRSKDYETVDLVLKEALDLGKLNGVTMEASIRNCIETGEFINAWVLFEASVRLSLVIGEGVSKQLLRYLVHNLHWIEAAVATEYCLKRGYSLESTDVMTLLSGLIGSNGDFDRALELLALIVDLRRQDLMVDVSEKTLDKLAAEYDTAREQRSSPELPSLGLLFSSLQRAMAENSWWSPSLTRLALSLACVAGHYEAAIQFVRSFIAESVLRVREGANEESMKVDLLQVFRTLTAASRVLKSSEFHGKSTYHYHYLRDESGSFDLFSRSSDPALISDIAQSARNAMLADQKKKKLVRNGTTSEDPMEQHEQLTSNSSIDGEVGHNQGVSKSQRVQAVEDTGPRATTTRLSSAILTELVACVDLLDLSMGPSRVQNFLSLHWELAHKVELVRSHQIKTTKTIADLYYLARRFYDDWSISETQFSIPPGSDRRIFRYICDHLNIAHWLATSTTGEVVVKVSFSRSAEAKETQPRAKYLLDMMKEECNLGPMRQIEGQPFRWNEVIKPFLHQLSPTDLQTAVVSLLHSSSLRYASSPSWAFLYAQVLLDAEVPFPPSMMHALLGHCDRRSDPYGVVEVLHFADTIRKAESLSNEGVGKDPDWLPLESAVGGVLNFRALRLGAQPLQSKFGAFNSIVDKRDNLSDKDWRRAVAVSWHGHLTLPQFAFTKNFMEVVSLMRGAGKSLDESTTKTMMRFLVATQIHSATTRQIFDSVNENKGLIVGHVECIALTRFIEFRLRSKNNPFRAGPTFENRYSFCSIRESATYRDRHYMVVDELKINPFIRYWSRNSARVRFGDEFTSALLMTWQQIHSSSGRLQLLALLTHLLRTRREAIRDEFHSYDRFMLVHLGMYAAFLVASEDQQFRNAFEFLYLLMDTVVQVQIAIVKRRVRSGEENTRENGRFRLNRRPNSMTPWK